MMRRFCELMVKILLGGAIIFTGAILGTLFASRWLFNDNKDDDIAIVSRHFGWSGMEVRAIAFYPDGRTIVVGYRSGGRSLLVIWDITTYKRLKVFELNENNDIEGICISPDGKLIAVSFYWQGVKIFDTNQFRLIYDFSRLGDVTMAFGAMAFSPKGDLFAAGNLVWKMPEGVLFKRMDIPKDFWVNGCDFSPDGRFLAISGFINESRHHPSPIAFICDVKTGRILKTLLCHECQEQGQTCAEGKRVDFHPDGKRVAVGTIADAFYVWNLETNRVELVRRKGGRWWVVKFSPDGRLLATSGAGGRVLVWNIATMKEVLNRKGHVLSVYDLAFNPIGDLLASGGMDGIVRLWKLRGKIWYEKSLRL